MPATSAEREDLRVTEAAALLGVAEGEHKTEDGTVLIHLMRPCRGKGRGRHIYEADMLAREASGGRFTDWPMFVDHESPAARKRAEGLPRSLRDVGGRVVRAWWDPTVEADPSRGFGQGAVVAEAKPVPWVSELISHDPKLVNVSLNTYATGVRPGNFNGLPGNVVEGFVDNGSADWVTLPGAGGRVVQLLEAAAAEAEPDAEDSTALEGITDDDLTAHIRAHRPDVAEALSKPGSGEEDEMDKAQIEEALRSEDGKALINEAVVEAVGPAVAEALRAVLPEAIGAAADVITEGAREAARAEARNGRLADHAKGLIQEAKLPEKFQAAALRKFEHVELEDSTDDEGKVTESAQEKLEKLVQEHLTEQRELIESIDPQPRKRRTTVANGEGGEPEPGEVTESEAEEFERGHLMHELREAGIDPHEAWGVRRSEERKPKPATEPTAA